MSVGVCIINKNGIVLAADSAGTYTGNKMFYNSMNKVFSLSRKYVYGAITYGATAIYNVSIDQVLKEFRAYLDTREEIGDFFDVLPLFDEFVRLNNTYYKFDIAERDSCGALIKNLVVEWGNRIKAVASSENAEDEIQSILNELKTAMNDSLRINNYDVSSYIEDAYNDYYNEVVGIVVPELNNFPAHKDALWGCICNYFNFSLKIETDNAMGLFFAGYGKKDAFPKFVHIKLYRVIGGQIKYDLIQQYEESNNHAQIVPLAQPDVILTFCKGKSSTFINYIPQKVESLITAKIDALPDVFSDEQKKLLKSQFSSSKMEIASAIAGTIQNNYVNPILNSVQLIPLPEMVFWQKVW